MFILSNFLRALAEILGIVITLAYWLLIIRAVISWVNPDPYNPIVQFLYKVTEPILYPIRRLMPTFNIGIDLSPLIAILILFFIRSFVVQTLIDLSLKMR